MHNTKLYQYSTQAPYLLSIKENRENAERKLCLGFEHMLYCFLQGCHKRDHKLSGLKPEPVVSAELAPPEAVRPMAASALLDFQYQDYHSSLDFITTWSPQECVCPNFLFYKKEQSHCKRPFRANMTSPNSLQ